MTRKEMAADIQARLPDLARHKAGERLTVRQMFRLVLNELPEEFRQVDVIRAATARFPGSARGLRSGASTAVSTMLGRGEVVRVAGERRWYRRPEAV